MFLVEKKSCIFGIITIKTFIKKWIELWLKITKQMKLKLCGIVPT